MKKTYCDICKNEIPDSENYGASGSESCSFDSLFEMRISFFDYVDACETCRENLINKTRELQQKIITEAQKVEDE